MGESILVFAVIAIMIGGFFVMKRLDAFLEANEEPLKQNTKILLTCSSLMRMTDYEKVISDIEKFKITHEDIKLIIYDGKNDDLTDMIKLYDHTGT